MTELEKGERVDIIGHWERFTYRPLFLSEMLFGWRGVELFPFPLAEALEAGRRLSVLIGGRQKQTYYASKILETKFEHFVATEDGSLGHKGLSSIFSCRSERIMDGGSSLLFSGPSDAKGVARASVQKALAKHRSKPECMCFGPAG